MKRGVLPALLTGGAVVLWAWAGVASATGSRPSAPLVRGTPIVGPPVGVPMPVPGSHRPALVIAGSGAQPLVVSQIAHANFRFADHVIGTGFRPGEMVKLFVDDKFSSSVVTGGSGTLTAVVHFTWIFCGPDARSTVPPTIQARGNEGSAAEVHEMARRCPMGIAVPMQSGGLLIHAFGFHPGEAVTARDVGPRGAGVGPAITAIADVMGRVRVTIRPVERVTCRSAQGTSGVLLSGQGGTTVLVPVSIRIPLPACPISGVTP